MCVLEQTVKSHADALMYYIKIKCSYISWYNLMAYDQSFDFNKIWIQQ